MQNAKKVLIELDYVEYEMLRKILRELSAYKGTSTAYYAEKLLVRVEGVRKIILEEVQRKKRIN